MYNQHLVEIFPTHIDHRDQTKANHTLVLRVEPTDHHTIHGIHKIFALSEVISQESEWRQRDGNNSINLVIETKLKDRKEGR